MRRTLAVLGLLAVLAAAGADEVYLHGGGVLRGEIVAERKDALVIEVGPGRITIPRSRVERIVLTTSDLTAYRQRAATLAAQDARGWLSLARWAQAHDLLTQAREAFARAAAADPTNAEAQEGLGRILVDGRWLSQDAANRARGLVEFEGRWVTVAERTALLEAQAVAAEVRRAEAESAARIREADARARAAEAEARRLEAEAQQAASAASGIPLGYPGAYGPFGGGVIVPVIVKDRSHRRHDPPHRQPPAPRPVPDPPRETPGPRLEPVVPGAARVPDPHH